MTTTGTTESGDVGSPLRGRSLRSGAGPVGAVRSALDEGPRLASDVLAQLRAEGLSEADIAKGKREAGAVSERGEDGIWRWRLDCADDLLLVVDCTEAIEVMPTTRKQRRRIEKLLARRRRLAEQVSGTGPSPLRRELAAKLAGVEAELDALDVEEVED